MQHYVSVWLKRSFVWLESKSEKNCILNKYVLAELMKDSKFWAVKFSENIRRNMNLFFVVCANFRVCEKSKAFCFLYTFGEFGNKTVGNWGPSARQQCPCVPCPSLPAPGSACRSHIPPPSCRGGTQSAQADSGSPSHKLCLLLKLQPGAKVDPQSKYLHNFGVAVLLVGFVMPCALSLLLEVQVLKQNVTITVAHPDQL